MADEKIIYKKQGRFIMLRVLKVKLGRGEICGKVTERRGIK